MMYCGTFSTQNPQRHSFQNVKLISKPPFLQASLCSVLQVQLIKINTMNEGEEGKGNCGHCHGGEDAVSCCQLKRAKRATWQHFS